MHFEAYLNKVMLLHDFTNQKVKKIQQNRFQIKKISKEECRVYPKVNLPDYMIKDSMFKTVLFLCLLVILCLKLRKAKKEKEPNIHLHIKEKREEYLNAVAKAVGEYERLQVLRSILLQAPALYKLGSNLMCESITKLPTKNYI